MTLEDIRQDLITDGKEVTSEWLILLTICASACAKSGYLESTRKVLGDRCGHFTGKSYSAKTVERVGEYLSENYDWFKQCVVYDGGFIKKLTIQVPTTFVRDAVNICIRRAVDICLSICLSPEIRNNNAYLKEEVREDIRNLSQRLHDQDDGGANRDKSLCPPSSQQQQIPTKAVNVLREMNEHVGFELPPSAFAKMLKLATARKIKSAISWAQTKAVAWVPAETKHLQEKRALVFLSYLTSYISGMGLKIWKVTRKEAYKCEKCGHYAEHHDASNQAGANKPPRSGQKSQETAQISSQGHSNNEARQADQSKGVKDAFADSLEFKKLMREMGETY